ncbi:MAG: hypothetical protein ACRECT_05455 [Thermoplasmata archaeon]
MLRTERNPQLSFSQNLVDAPHTMARDLLIAVAPPPRTHVYDLSGWPHWLAPTYRSGGHRTPTRFKESEK